MANLDIKQKIIASLGFFSTGQLSANALNLFQTLGYNTERQAPFDKPNYATFKDFFVDTQSKFNEEKALVKDWEYVDLLFQLSKEEVRKQISLFDTKKVDSTIIETYLFFTIALVKNQYRRTELSNITREVNHLFPMPVMILFKYGQSLTLSVINRRQHRRDERKDVLEKITLIKDIKIENPHRAHVEILFDLSFDELKRKHGFTNFVELHNAWQKTLDTKELNKRFFQELANWYFWATKKVAFPDDAEKNEEIRNATSLIRLITRIIFIWFIKEKDLVPEALFDRTELNRILKEFAKSKKSNSYYHAILQNLFFGTLNQKMNERGFAKEGSFEENKANYGVKNLFRYANHFAISEKEALSLFKDIPFLNGGLFDCLDKENDDGKVLYSDGFSRNPKKQALVPDFLFFGAEEECDLNAVYGTKNKRYKVKGLIDILSGYKFTVAENTPVEEEVALDPELLGKVFENLLAAYNPETGATARKQTGSFYTPREIVNYMVDEALIAYLNMKLEANQSSADNIEERLRHLFAYNDEDHLFSAEEVDTLIDAIDHLKALDPAVGSGAFPMGILHKLVLVLHKLDADNKLWKEVQRRKAIKETEDAFKIGNKQERENRLKEISDVFEYNSDDYGRKLYLIENCIYGVDIQPIAVQIAKLRFFISLVVNQNKQPGKENFGIRSLPNLETKFVAANTLIGLDKPIRYSQIEFKNPEIAELENELKELRHRYFSAKTRKEKVACQKEDKTLRQKIARLLVNDGWAQESAKQIVAFDPYDQNASSPFFDPEWMFGVTDGFDVVIGNPPYLGHKEIGAQKQLEFKKVFGFSDDMYNYFFYKGIELLRIHGTICYITPNTFFTLSSKKVLRKKLIENEIRQLFLVGYVFNEAYVDTAITIAVKNNNAETYDIKYIVSDYSIIKPRIFTANCETYKSLSDCVFFKPSELNIRLFDNITKKADSLKKEFGASISSIKVLNKNKSAIENHWKRLKPGDVSLLGLMCEGAQGLVTGNNSKYIGKICRSKEEEQSVKNDLILKISELKGRLDNNNNIFDIAEDIKAKHSNPSIFGKFFLYKTVKEKEVNYFSNLSLDTQINGSDKDPLWVAYARGNEEGSKWWVPYIEAIDWSCKNVKELKEGKTTNSRWQGSDFYSTTGFGWVDYFTDKIKSFFIEPCPYSKNVVKFHSFSILSDKFFVGLLNSRLITYYVKNFITNTHTLQINDGKQIPFIIPNNLFIKSFECVVEYIVFQLRQSIDINLFESLIDAMVYELYLPDEIKAADCEVLKHLTNLPELKDGLSDEQKLQTIEKVYQELSNPDHPVSIAMKKMLEVPEVRIIEGIDKE